MATEFDSNAFEHDYILKVLDLYRADMKVYPEDETTDRCAAQLTAFMMGYTRKAVEQAKLMACPCELRKPISQDATMCPHCTADTPLGIRLYNEAHRTWLDRFWNWLSLIGG